MENKEKVQIIFEDKANQVWLEKDFDQMLVFIVQDYYYKFTARNIDEKIAKWLGEVVYRQLQRANKRGKRKLAQDFSKLQDEAISLIEGYK